MRNTMRNLLGLFLLPGLAACDVIGPSCTLEARPGIVLTVIDSISGLVVAGDDVVATATDGFYSDTGSPNSEGMVPLAFERRGSYSVEVTANGFRPWVMNSVRVMEDACHVRTVELLARMQR